MKVLITGATGFLGGALARRMAQDGHEVIGTGRNLQLGAALQVDGVQFQPAGLDDVERLTALAQGCEGVVHSAALSSNWGPSRAFEAANVRGTQSVVAACERAGVGRLVHVSTPSIYHSGRDRLDIAEDATLPRPVNEYARTKALAEHVVMGAHERGVPSILIRPRGLFGPGDTSLFPRILRLLSSGRLRIIGDGQNVIDLTYVDNVVDSLVRSLEAPATACGRAYNITNGEPIRLWDLITDIAIRLQVRPPQGHVSLPAARRLAGLMEVLWRFLPLKGEPPVTRYTVELLALNMTLDISAAQEQIGYAPRISMAEGLDRFFEWWQEQVPQ